MLAVSNPLLGTGEPVLYAYILSMPLDAPMLLHCRSVSTPSTS